MHWQCKRDFRIIKCTCCCFIFLSWPLICLSPLGVPQTFPTLCGHWHLVYMGGGSLYVCITTILPQTWTLPFSLLSWVWRIPRMANSVSNSPTSAFLNLYSVLFAQLWIYLEVGYLIKTYLNFVLTLYGYVPLIVVPLLCVGYKFTRVTQCSCWLLHS